MNLFKGFNPQKTPDPKFSIKNLCKQEPHTAIEILAQLEHQHKRILNELVNYVMDSKGFDKEQATLTILDDVRAELLLKYRGDDDE